jgi:hypothetical protein
MSNAAECEAALIVVPPTTPENLPMSFDHNAHEARMGTILRVGLNWYVGRNARVMFNYIRGKADPNRNGVTEKVTAVGARAQIDF